MSKINEICKYVLKTGYENPETKLPSEAALCIKFGVHRTTSRLALTILKNADIVSTIKGKGHFLSKNFKEMLGNNFLSNINIDRIDRKEVTNQNKKDLILTYINHDLKDTTIVKSYYYQKNDLIKISFNILDNKKIFKKNIDLVNLNWISLADKDNITISKIKHKLFYPLKIEEILIDSDLCKLNYNHSSNIPLIISKFMTDEGNPFEFNLIFIPKNKMKIFFSSPFVSLNKPI